MMKGKGKYKFTKEREEYVLKMKQKKFPWWIFLILLAILIMFIRINDKVKFIVTDTGNNPIENAIAQLDKSDPAASEKYIITNKTDDDGIVKFKIKGRMIYQIILGIELKDRQLSADFTAQCFDTTHISNMKSVLIKAKVNKIELHRQVADIDFKVVLESDPSLAISDADVSVSSPDNPNNFVLNGITDISGISKINGVATCSDLLVIASKIGFGSDTLNKSYEELMKHIDNRTLYLKNIAQPCNTQTHAGGQGITFTEHDLGQKKGDFKIAYDMQTIPDEMTVYWGAEADIDSTRILFTTGGMVSGSKEVTIPFDLTTTVITVRVEGPSSGTSWSYMVKCPDKVQ